MESTVMPQNNSHQQLMDDDSDGLDTRVPSLNSVEEQKSFRTVTRSQWCTVAVLCFVNLINYMDRYTMAGITDKISDHFDIRDDKTGLLQTVFIISYMVFAPIFGYLGDRYNRKAIMAFGVFLWCFTTLLGSFMDTYGPFIAFRAMVGIGEASYSTIAPTIISDLFVKDLRAKMLALFYFAIPVGSGLGYIIGSETANATGQWQWALRVTPILGAAAVLLIIFVVKDPPRGESEGRSHVKATSWSQDLKLLLKNRSFVLSTCGFTCVSFVTGALAWWGPQYIYRGAKLQPGNHDIQQKDISFKFGIITMVSGLLGVPLGQVIASKLKTRYPKADPLVCSFGLIMSTPFLFAAILIPRVSLPWCFFLVFMGELLLNLNWSIVADILLYVVTPTRRSTAEAFQILISHAFGDAGSPYFIGLMTDALARAMSSTTQTDNLSTNMTAGIPTSADEVSYYSMQYSLFLACFVEVLGGVFFLFNAIYIVRDRVAAEREIRGETNEQPTNLYADESQSQSS